MKKPKKDVYEIISERLIEGLEDAIKNESAAPWQKPWSTSGAYPVNFRSQKHYRGINVLILHMAGYESPTWLTYNQAKEQGGMVRKGEKGTPVVFWNWIKKDATGKTTKSDAACVRKIPFLRYYTVFNIAQVDGVEDKWTPAPDKDSKPIEQAQQIVSDMPNAPTITHNEARAFYRPTTDTVNMPRLGLFDSAEEYHSTMFHELAHSTGHKSRLNRDTISEGSAGFGTQTYSKEELVAEMAAAMLCGVVGIENKIIDNSIAYLRSWIKKLKDDPKLAVQAGAQAQRAADCIQGIKWDK